MANVAAGGERASRWELYRLLSEPLRLRLLALAAEEELTIGELAELLDEAQPNVSKHAAPLRQAGLLVVRKEGTRTLIRLAEGTERDPVTSDAVATGRSLCVDDGSLARVAAIVRDRDAQTRAFFARPRDESDPATVPSELSVYLSALAPLIASRSLAVDAGTGDGGLLDVLAPVFAHVVAFDREEAQLQRCRRRIEARGFDNVTLAQGDVDAESIQKLIRHRGGADAVFAARLLHHAPKPSTTLASLAALARPGGAVVVLDYAAHEDESMRAVADLWLGFAPAELRRFAREIGLIDVHVHSLPARVAPHTKSPAPDAHLPWQLLVARSHESLPHASSTSAAAQSHPKRKHP
ncbi:MAG: ArsR/SmtB family transcription factor [Polyangiales bacterium]